MGDLRLLLARAIRSNGRAVVGLALVLALIGGASLTAFGAARRTASGFSRYLERSDASDLAVNVVATSYDGSVDGSLAGTFSFAQEARHLPGVVSDASYIGLESIFLANADGSLASFGAEALGSLDGRFFASDRVAVTAGRLPDERALDEVFLNETAAAGLGATVGSTVHLAVLEQGDGDPRDLPVLDRVDVEVVGIGLFPDEVLADDFDRSSRLLVTPATTRKYLDVAGSYFWQGLHLGAGTSIDATIAGYQSLLDEGYDINVHRRDQQVASVERSTRPLVAALVAFGAASGAAALLLGLLGALRLIASGAEDARTLRALGVAPRVIRAGAAAPALAAGTLGALGAATVAVVLSPIGPVGPVRAVDPLTGVGIDATLLLVGFLVLTLVLGGAASVAARAVLRPDRPTRSPRPSRVVDAVGRSGLGPAATIGTAHALDGQGGSGVTSRSTIAACMLSIVAIVSALTFGSGVRQLLRDPDRYGWAADIAVEVGGGYQALDPSAGAAAVQAADGAIGSLAVTANGKVHLGDRQVSAVGLIAVAGDPPITVLEGRLPRTPAEVALGRVTARQLDVAVGGSLRQAAGAVRVVGMVALPAIGPQASSHPSLGQGALFTFDGLAARDATASPSVALIRFRDGTDVDALTPVVTGLVATHMAGLPPEAAEVYRDLRPADVVGLGPASRTAYLLAVVLVSAAIVGIALTLSSSVRRRARTYAILASLGFDRAALRRTVRWQTDVVVGVSLLVGLPLGITVGRLAWRAFADQLGVRSQPVVPLGLIAATAAALVVVANVVALAPARTAVRHSHRLATLEER